MAAHLTCRPRLGVQKLRLRASISTRKAGRRPPRLSGDGAPYPVPSHVGARRAKPEREPLGVIATAKPRDKTSGARPSKRPNVAIIAVMEERQTRVDITAWAGLTAS